MRPPIAGNEFVRALVDEGLTRTEAQEVSAWIDSGPSFVPAIEKLEVVWKDETPVGVLAAAHHQTMTGSELAAYILRWAILAGEIGKLSTIRVNEGSLHLDANMINEAAVDLGFGTPQDAGDRENPALNAPDLTSREKILVRAELLAQQAAG